MSSSKDNYVLFGIDFRNNPEEKELIRLIREEPSKKPVVFCLGDAGTGKTFTALAAALSLVRGKAEKKKYKEIYYVREPVELGHRLGYLKGTEEDKFAPYLGPLLDNYNHLMKNNQDESSFIRKERITNKKASIDPLPEAYRRLPKDIIPLAPEFLRGRSFEEAIILVDEAQNLTLNEIQTFVTRLGPFTKMVLLGSVNQIDIPNQSIEKNDFMTAYSILEPTGLVGFVKLEKSMRSSFVGIFDQCFVDYKKKGKL